MQADTAETFEQKAIVLGLYGFLAFFTLAVVALHFVLLIASRARGAAERLLSRMHLARRSLDQP